MSSKRPLRVYVVDDESLAVKRLTRLLRQTDRVEIVGSTVTYYQRLHVPGYVILYVSYG